MEQARRRKDVGTINVRFWHLAAFVPSLGMSASESERTGPNKQSNSAEATLTLGNTGVTKTGVVERGKLQRDEALEDQKDCSSKLFKVQGGAGGGE